MEAYKITKTGEGIIPEGETIIKKDAFKMCKKLTSIVIPEGVTTIENGAFKDCINLILPICCCDNHKAIIPFIVTMEMGEIDCVTIHFQ